MQVLLTWGSEVLLSSSSEGLFVATLLPGWGGGGGGEWFGASASAAARINEPVLKGFMLHVDQGDGDKRARDIEREREIERE